MARLRHLEKAMGRLFKAPAKKQPDTQRRSREEAKRLATIHEIEIEKLRDGGMNVWAPKGLAADDPFDGDHFADDWNAALEMINAYVALLPVQQ